MSDLGGMKSRRSNLEWLAQDLRGGLRQFLRHPGYALLVAGTLAIGLATSTAVFTYLNAYQKPFPGADAENLFQLYQGAEDFPYGPLSYPDFLDLVEFSDGRFGVAASGSPQFAVTVRHENQTDVIFGQGVTGSFFPLLRIEMSLGRGLLPEDDEAGAPLSVVISHAYWARRYGSNPDALGRTILLNNQPHTIVGVAGPRYLGSMSAFHPDIWLPFARFKRVYWSRSDREVNREVGSVTPFLRLPDSADSQAIRESLSVLATRLDLEVPLEDRERRFQLEPARWIHPAMRQAELPTARIMLLAAASLLLLACANVANLVLSAGTRRRSEMALRSTIGASRWRLVRQLLSENLILSAVAGMLALGLAGPAASRLSSYFAQPSVWGANVPREIQFDGRVLAFGCLAALFAALVSGVLPALRSSGSDLSSSLKAGGRWSSEGPSGGKARRLGIRDLLVSGQIALTVVLLFLSGLVVRTLDSARSVDPGFETETTLASFVSTSSMEVPRDQRQAFFNELIERFRRLPWVRDAAVSAQAPLSPHPSLAMRVGGQEESIQVTAAKVVPGFMEAMEVNVVDGRSFLPTDTTRGAGVVMVNQTLASRISEDGNVIGLQLWARVPGESEERAFEVVGVVQDVRQTNVLGDPGPTAYLSLPQHAISTGNAFLLKVVGDPATAVERMEAELRAVDPRIAIVNILPYSDVVGGFLYPMRMNAELFSVIGILGLILSAAGVFGVTSLAVAAMQREIGVRLAIGAGARAITRLVLSRVSLAVCLGLGLGITIALGGSRVAESLVWGISPMDPISMGAGILVLLLSVLLAVGAPLGRALMVDPVNTLRVE